MWVLFHDNKSLTKLKIEQRKRHDMDEIVLWYGRLTWSSSVKMDVHQITSRYVSKTFVRYNAILYRSSNAKDYTEETDIRDINESKKILESIRKIIDNMRDAVERGYERWLCKGTLTMSTTQDKHDIKRERTKKNNSEIHRRNEW